MRAHRMLARSSFIAVALVIAGCTHTVQTTSGAEYLSASPEILRSGDGFDQQLRAAANVEPMLRFPARIGLARIAPNGCGAGVVSPPAEEGSAWLDLAENLGPEYGEFVPISPLVAELVAPSTKQNCYHTDYVRDIVGTIRLAAARQHVDVVMIYEVDGTANSRNNPLSIANWTVIGAFILPSQNVRAQGVANAMLIDVRNGYPYGTIQAKADDKTLSTRFDYDASIDLMNQVKTAAVRNLAHEAQELMVELKRDLALRD